MLFILIRNELVVHSPLEFLRVDIMCQFSIYPYLPVQCLAQELGLKNACLPELKIVYDTAVGI